MPSKSDKKNHKQAPKTYKQLQKEIQGLMNRCVKASDLKNLESIERSLANLFFLDDNELLERLQPFLTTLSRKIQEKKLELTKNTEKSPSSAGLFTHIVEKQPAQEVDYDGATLRYRSPKGVEIWDVPPVSASNNDTTFSEQEEVIDRSVSDTNEQGIAAKAKIKQGIDARSRELEAFDEQVRLLLAKKDTVRPAGELAECLAATSTRYKNEPEISKANFIESVTNTIKDYIPELKKHRQSVPVIGPIIRGILNALRSFCSLFGNHTFFKTDSMKKVDALLVTVQGLENPDDKTPDSVPNLSS